MKQIVKGNEKNVYQNSSCYASGLIHCRNKRSVAEISNHFKTSPNKLFRHLKKTSLLENFFSSIMIQLVMAHSKIKPGNFIIDDTAIHKKYSKVIQGTSEIYDTSTGCVKKGFSVVVLIWSNGDIEIPIDFAYWVNREYCDNYKKKNEIAIELIKRNMYLPFDKLLFDGLYTTTTMLNFCKDNNIKFEARMHANRLIQTKKGSFQLKHHPKLKLTKNNRCKTIKAQWQGFFCYVTILKRKNKKGEWNIVYQISNFKTNAKNHVAYYEKRWPIEKMFRTCKQKLGLGDCFSKKIYCQRAHIQHVFISFVFLQTEKLKYHLKNPEEAVKKLLRLKPQELANRISRFVQNFGAIA